MVKVIFRLRNIDLDLSLTQGHYRWSIHSRIVQNLWNCASRKIISGQYWFHCFLLNKLFCRAAIILDDQFSFNEFKFTYKNRFFIVPIPFSWLVVILCNFNFLEIICNSFHRELWISALVVCPILGHSLRFSPGRLHAVQFDTKCRTSEASFTEFSSKTSGSQYDRCRLWLARTFFRRYT